MPLNPNAFQYDLPESLIATLPASPRDHCRLNVVNRLTHKISHFHFYDLPQLLPKNAVLILNESKVFPARLIGKKSSGGRVELLLLSPINSHSFTALSKPGLKNQTLIFNNNLSAITTKPSNDEGICELRFNQPHQELYETLNQIGHTPIPPYIDTRTSENDLRHQYQTIYAKNLGSVAAPTAGLHFTKTLIDTLINHGFTFEFVTLHVGLGTFKSPSQAQIKTKTLHHESYFISPSTLNRLNQYKTEGRPIVAVGTTSVRTLESAFNPASGRLEKNNGRTNLFIYPPHQFNFVDHIITNFHLPQSSLLMLISAFCSMPNTSSTFSTFNTSLIGHAYEQAISKSYHFYSFGDAQLIL